MATAGKDALLYSLGGNFLYSACTCLGLLENSAATLIQQIVTWMAGTPFTYGLYLPPETIDAEEISGP